MFYHFDDASQLYMLDSERQQWVPAQLDAARSDTILGYRICNHLARVPHSNGLIIGGSSMVRMGDGRMEQSMPPSEMRITSPDTREYALTTHFSHSRHVRANHDGTVSVLLHAGFSEVVWRLKHVELPLAQLASWKLLGAEERQRLAVEKFVREHHRRDQREVPKLLSEIASYRDADRLRRLLSKQEIRELIRLFHSGAA